MIREERFCAEMVERVQSAQEETEARGWGLLPPAQGTRAGSTPGQSLSSCSGVGMAGNGIREVKTSFLPWAEWLNVSHPLNPSSTSSLMMRIYHGNFSLLNSCQIGKIHPHPSLTL